MSRRRELEWGATAVSTSDGASESVGASADGNNSAFEECRMRAATVTASSNTVGSAFQLHSVQAAREAACVMHRDGTPAAVRRQSQQLAMINLFVNFVSFAVRAGTCNCAPLATARVSRDFVSICDSAVGRLHHKMRRAS
jgi:hypothetical protein